MYADVNWVGWFYRAGGRRVGPVPRSTIAGLVADGRLLRSARVWKAWNHGDEFQLVPTSAAEAVENVSAGLPGSPTARLWRMIHGPERLQSIN